MVKKLLKKRFIAVTLAFSTFLFSATSGAQAFKWFRRSSETKQCLSNERSIPGYVLKKTIYGKNGSHILEYQHEKTGCWIVVEKNNDAEKKFAISVKTPPESDKGTNHIIEHCILNGSEEYPLKNTIWELSNRSYSTFLNAMTYPCYTTFPVASYDAGELKSLAKIYADGVFNPLFLKDERIFKKEGLRFELDEQGKLVANGTVFNEMKQGASNDVLDSMLKNTFPDTQGKFVSGGVPKSIVDLTYEKICATYKKYYHPSNMVINLSGDTDHEEFMKWLDADYLQNYEKQESQAVFKKQDPQRLKDYEVVKYYRSGTEKDIVSADAVYILDHEFASKNLPLLEDLSTIINDPNTERSKYVKGKGFLMLSMNFINSFYDPLVMISVSADNMDLLSQENIESLIQDVFKNYPITGSEVKQVLNEDDFERKLEDATAVESGNVPFDSFMNSFIRFGEPCSDKYFNLDGKNQLYDKNTTEQELNKLLGTILPQKHAVVVCQPSDDKSLDMAYVLENKLLSLESQKDELTVGWEEQKSWSASPNNPQDLEKLDKMFKKLADVNIPKYKCDLQSSNFGDVKCYYCPQEIGDFLHFKLVFKVNHLTDEEKKYLSLLSNALYRHDTNSFPRSDLETQKSEKLRTSYSLKVDAKNKNAFIALDMTCDKNNIDESINLVNEETNNLNFTDRRNLKEFAIMQATSLGAQSKTMLKFSDLVMTQIFSDLNYIYAGQSSEEVKAFYKDIIENIDNDDFVSKIGTKLSDIKNKVFNRTVLEGVGICGSESQKDFSFKQVKKLFNILNQQKQDASAKINLGKLEQENTVFIDKNQVNNQIFAFINSPQLSNDPSFGVTCKLLNDKFLMPHIREEGGAYGASIEPLKDENMVMWNSYCDPNAKSTIETFRSVAKFLETCEVSQHELESIAKSKLGGFGQKNKLTLARSQLTYRIIFNENYCEILNDRIEKLKKVSPGTIKEHGNILAALIETMKIYLITNNRSVVGNGSFPEIVE